ncbi:MAG TPA: hypothetical protein VK866_14920 [Acidimicrobiales bacterium]|nr:hypothetical protein [Acidimicrobiales bacterium]
MSWHPSRARSGRALLHTAVVQAVSGRSMLVRLDSGDDRLLPLPDPAPASLVGTTVLVRDGHEWVAAAPAPASGESVALRQVGDEAAAPPPVVAPVTAIDLRDRVPPHHDGGARDRFGRRVESLRRRRVGEVVRTTPSGW